MRIASVRMKAANGEQLGLAALFARWVNDGDKGCR